MRPYVINVKPLISISNSFKYLPKGCICVKPVKYSTTCDAYFFYALCFDVGTLNMHMDEVTSRLVPALYYLTQSVVCGEMGETLMGFSLMRRAANSTKPNRSRTPAVSSIRVPNNVFLLVKHALKSTYSWSEGRRQKIINSFIDFWIIYSKKAIKFHIKYYLWGNIRRETIKYKQWAEKLAINLLVTISF